MQLRDVDCLADALVLKQNYWDENWSHPCTAFVFVLPWLCAPQLFLE